MADPWLDEWMDEVSSLFHAMEEYQGQTEFLSDEDFRLFTVVKDALLSGLPKFLKKSE